MAACGSYGNVAPVEDCADCVQLVRSTRKVQIPCTRNVQQPYTVKVPRTVTERVPRTVSYTDYEDRTKQVAYQVMRKEQRTRTDNQDYTVPVTKHGMKKVSVTKKVPKTIYVDVVTQEDRPYTYTVMEKRTRQVTIPYFVNVPETKYRTENYKEPVQRTKTVYDNQSKTVYDTVTKTRCVQQTKMITKEIPVFNVKVKQPQPCPPGVDCGQSGGGGGGGGYAAVQPSYGSGDGGQGFNPGNGGGYGDASAGGGFNAGYGSAEPAPLPAPAAPVAQVDAGYGQQH